MKKQLNYNKCVFFCVPVPKGRSLCNVQCAWSKFLPSAVMKGDPGVYSDKIMCDSVILKAFR